MKNHTHEQWKPVRGHEDRYLVSSTGRVWSLATRKAMSQSKTRAGHLRLSIGNRCARRTRTVHILVLEAFVGPRPDGLVACHNDGDPANNRLENLRWDTASSNVFDAVRHGTHNMTARTHCPRGHEYTSDNTYVSPAGDRRCQQCRRRSHERHAHTRKLRGRAPQLA